MDLALSRLRIVGGVEGCENPINDQQFCPDQELFERLVSELAVSMAPPISAPARSVGPNAFALSFDTTLTSIDADRVYWSAGTEGSGDGVSSEVGNNEDPDSMLVWNRLRARKGLPFGFEAGASLGHGPQTSWWTFGLSLKWSVFEGFRTGLGQAPDVSVEGTVLRGVGSSQATVQLYVLDLTLSKPFVLAPNWTVSPFVGLQTLFVDVSSGVVDLTPGGPAGSSGTPEPARDAVHACRAEPGHQPGTTLQCTGDGSDYVNDVVFEDVTQTRARAALGAQARYKSFTMSLSLLFDLVTPGLAAEARRLSDSQISSQVTGNLTLGAVL